MEEEKLIEKRRVKNGILANAKTDPKNAVNEAEFSGKIVNVFKMGKDTIFTVSCGYPGMKKNSEGSLLRNLISIRFFGEEGNYYASLYHKDDFAIFKAVVQTRTNQRYNTKTVEFWGLSIESNKKNIIAKDINKVHIIGRITDSWLEGKTWASVIVKTQLWKIRPNVLSEDVNETEDLYRSRTRVRCTAGPETENMVNFKLTKGTNIEIYGHVYGRWIKDEKTNKRRLIQTVIADEITVVGNIQPSNVNPISEVHNPENVGLEDNGEEFEEAVSSGTDEEFAGTVDDNTSSVFSD